MKNVEVLVKELTALQNAWKCYYNALNYLKSNQLDLALTELTTSGNWVQFIPLTYERTRVKSQLRRMFYTVAQLANASKQYYLAACAYYNIGTTSFNLRYFEVAQYAFAASSQALLKAEIADPTLSLFISKMNRLLFEASYSYVCRHPESLVPFGDVYLAQHLDTDLQNISFLQNENNLATNTTTAENLEEQLLYLIKHGQTGEVAECIAKGVNVNCIVKTYTPLSRACLLNKLQVVILLLQHPQLDINFGEPENTPFLTMLRGQLNYTRKTFAAVLFADSKLSPIGNQHALLFYARIGDLEKVKVCIDIRHCEPNYFHPRCDNALINAVDMSRIDVVRYLLSLKVNINDTNKWEEPPITIAIRKGFLDIAHLLLDRSELELHKQSSLSGTPLTAALFYKHDEFAIKLLAREKKFSNAQHPGALMCVIARDNPELLRLLISKGADVNGNCGKEGYKQTIDIKRTKCASPFADDNLPAFDVPIVAALQRNSCKIIPILLVAGADIDKKGVSGKSARELLTDNTQPKESRQLIKDWLSNNEQRAPVGYGTTFSAVQSVNGIAGKDITNTLNTTDFFAKNHMLRQSTNS